VVFGIEKGDPRITLSSDEYSALGVGTSSITSIMKFRYDSRGNYIKAIDE
jgi:hypothetical protein